MHTMPMVVVILFVGQRTGDPPEPPDRIALWEVVGKFVKPVEIAASDAELPKLYKLRANAAAKELELRSDEFKNGRGTLFVCLGAGRRLLESKLTLAQPNEVRTVVENYVSVARWIESLNQDRVEAGAIKPQDFEMTRYFRIDAEIMLLRLGGTLPVMAKTSAKAKAAELKPIVSFPASKLPAPKNQVNDGGPIVALVREAGNGEGESARLPPFVKVQQFSIDPNEPELQRLYKERANSAITELSLRHEEFMTGRGNDSTLQDAALRTRNARWELIDDAGQRLGLLKDYRDFAATIHERYKYGCLAAGAIERLRFPHINAAVDVARSAATSEGIGRSQLKAGLPTEATDNPPELRDDWEEPEFAKAKHYKIDETEKELWRLPKLRMNVAISATRHCYREFRVGRGTMDTMLTFARLARDARLDLAGNSEKRQQILTEYRDLMLAIENLNQARFNAGAIKQQDLEQSKCERLGAEIDLLRTKPK